MQHPLRSDSSQRPEDSGLPSALCSELWALIIERLNGGEVLIADQQFQAAFEEDYRQLIGAAITPSIQRQLNRMIAQVNRHQPETYVAKGVQNGVSRAFGEGVRTLNWITAKVQEKGVRSIQRFAKQDNVRDLLEEINVPLGDIDALDCIQSAVEELAKAQPAIPAPRLIPSLAEFEALSQSAPEPLQAKAEPESALVDPDVQLAIEAGEIDEKEVTRRAQQVDKRQTELEAEEMANARKTEEAPAASKGTKDEGRDGVEDDLTEEEKAHGVFLGRVEMRVAGNYRRVPYKIMPDEEEPERFIIVQCNPDTDELVPQMRRGAKRFVEKDTRDGVWKVV